jgi:hypothetical protein
LGWISLHHYGNHEGWSGSQARPTGLHIDGRDRRIAQLGAEGGGPCVHLWHGVAENAQSLPSWQHCR